jgi:hypothetical protein
MKKHNCRKCKYYYKTTCNKSKIIYNALLDDIQNIYVEHKSHCCGHDPGGVALDEEQPKCQHYEEVIK